MKPPIEFLFESCKELFNKDDICTLEDFQDECKRDNVIGDGVSAICKAIERYSTEYNQETIAAWKKDHDQLQVNRLGG